LRLSAQLAAAVLKSAARAYPAECCGLIEGTPTDDGWRALAIHEAANLAEEPARRFLIDPQTHFDLLRHLRGSERRIIGCFHSHPDGPAEPSATDRASASEHDFLWLIAGGSPASGFTLNAYRYSEASGFASIAVCSDEAAA
jgi:proteasome lid subunit RPN8/RPN11